MLQFGEYRDAKMLSSRVEAITLDEVQTLAQRLFDAPTLTLAALGPTKGLMRSEEIQNALTA